jgi:hypothetical protein
MWWSIIYGLSFAGHEAMTALMANTLISLPVVTPTHSSSR